ncbi:hypothetical protein GV828_04860 [Flavobacterium sp. NST-5]|uniref:Lipoprotein n=1 Tax=Flavobacterium ichthyis TaxID=2698827 RepID=A0ABW9Z7B4_9FLAO|nr:hypothetical protein [Flavobacterium ichthyis]NBL64529.1 hypothetical protein [Flavobacterium ichthyis]
MKKLFYLLLTTTLFTSCIFLNNSSDDFVPTGNEYRPVVMNRANFESSVALLPPKPIENSGKIYVRGQLLFINEKREGFHIFNYENPSSPIPIAYIQIPGATDLAMREGTIYINQAVDLVTIQYGIDSQNFTITNRNRNIFPQMLDPNGFLGEHGSDEIIVNYEQL